MWNGDLQYDEPGDFDQDSSDMTVDHGNGIQKVQISNNIQINVRVSPIMEKTDGFSFNGAVEKVTEKFKLTETNDYGKIAESINEKLSELVTDVMNKEVEDESVGESGSEKAYIVWIVISCLLIIIIIVCIWLCYR